MKKFRFTLEKLLSFKESMLDKEKITLAQLRMQLRAIEEKIEYLKSERQALSRRLREETAKGTTADKLRTLQFQIETIGYQLESLYQEQARMAQRVEAQLHIVIDLTREKTELEMLREKQLEEFRKEEAKETELIISEFVSGNIIRQSKA